MAYLGNDLQVAFPTYRNIDDISGSFNGVTTSFPLTVAGVAPIPAPINSQQCLISVNGVVQRPDDSGTEGFRLSGGNIIFASAPAGGVDFFGVILAGADYVNIGANFPSGTAVAPSITFDSDLDTGIYNPAGNQIGFTTGGVQRLVINSSGQISGGLGTAAAPVISFISDPNTGIYSPGADQVAISTGGSGRLFVDASGRIGIGTSGPGFPLEVRATSSTGQVQILGSDNTNATWRLATPSSSVVAFGGALTHAVAFGGFDNTTQAFSERARIDSSGRLLVGTSSASGEGLLRVSGGSGTNVGVIEIGSNTARPTAADSELSKVIFTSGSNSNAYASIAAFSDGASSSTVDIPGRLVFSTTADGASSPTERLRITSAGRVGIGTTSPGKNIEIASTTASVQSQLYWNANNSDAGDVERGAYLFSTNRSNGTQRSWGIYGHTNSLDTTFNSSLIFKTVTSGTESEKVRIDNGGRLLVGTATADTASLGALFQIQATSGIASALIKRNDNGVLPSYLYLGKSRGTTVNSTTIVQDGDSLGAIRFTGADGSTEVGSIAAQITAAVDGTPGANDMPGRLVFSTTADGASSPTERMRIKANGTTCIGTSTEGTMSGDAVVAIGPNIGIISKRASVAASGTVDININTGGGGYQGFLIVANTNSSNAAIRTHTTFSVFGRGTDSSIQQIATDNGTTSGASFTVTTPSNGVIRVTNTTAAATDVDIQFFGGTSG